MSLEGKVFSHYRILQLVGRGGMGEVYLAEDVQIARQVAVKMIRIESVQPDDETVAHTLRQFLREATTIARLDHPGILQLYDYGETVIDGSHLAYLIIPYRAEGSLIAWLRKLAQMQKSQQLTLKQIQHIVQQAGRALQYAHDHQVMHLDVKPANFLIRSRSADDPYPDLLLSDFGIARLASTTSHSSQSARGTPTYMAPEQCVGQPTFASDQYALAIMAYELLAGSPPFQGAPMSVMFAHLQEQPKPARTLNPQLPPDVDLVLQCALAKRPEGRFASVAAFARAFQEAFQGVDDATTLRVLRPSPATPQLQPQVPFALPSSTLAPAQEPVTFPPTTQEKITFPPRGSAFEQGPSTQGSITPSRPMGPMPGSVTLPPRSTPASRQRLRSPVTIGLLLLLVLIVVGASVGVYGAATGKLFGKASHGPATPVLSTQSVQATASSRAHATATAQADARIPGRVWHVGNAGTTEALNSVIWANSRLLAVGTSGTILSSSDGRSWAAQKSGVGFNLGSIAWSGTQFVAVGVAGTILSSSDGANWTTISRTDDGTLISSALRFRAVTWSDTQFIVVGSGGYILTSPDGSAWTVQADGPGSNSNGNWPLRTAETLYSVIWTGSQYVAVGQTRTILTSPDGTNWTAIPLKSSTVGDLFSIIWTGSQYVAVGIGSTGILTSPNGNTWTTHIYRPLAKLYSVIWTGSQYVAVGTHGTILTSPDGIAWTAQKSGTTEDLFSVAWTHSQLVVVGDHGTFLTSP